MQRARQCGARTRPSAASTHVRRTPRARASPRTRRARACVRSGPAAGRRCRRRPRRCRSRRLDASSAAASATAVVSEPPRPSVVTSWSCDRPWKPATMGTSPRSIAAATRSARIPMMRALPWLRSVRMPACGPVSDTAGTPRSSSAIVSIAIEICSPAASSMSTSRRCAAPETCAARPSSSSVVSPIAETTTHTGRPVTGGCRDARGDVPDSLGRRE